MAKGNPVSVEEFGHIKWLLRDKEEKKDIPAFMNDVASFCKRDIGTIRQVDKCANHEEYHQITIERKKRKNPQKENIIDSDNQNNSDANIAIPDNLDNPPEDMGLSVIEQMKLIDIRVLTSLALLKENIEQLKNINGSLINMGAYIRESAKLLNELNQKWQ